MHGDEILHAVFWIFTGAALLSALALYARQSLLVAYIVLGGVLGPWGLNVVSDTETVQGIGHVGIIFLLFLLGLNLHPQKLLHMLREATYVTLVSSLLFALLGGLVAWWSGFDAVESLLIGAVMIFSSTIIGLKLLPTTELHHRRMGEIMISVLLLQDIIAIAILLLLEGLAKGAMPWSEAVVFVISLPVISAVAYLCQKYVLMRLIQRFDTIKEYVFLLAVGWCIGLAQLASALGLSYEIGAFIAGVALATSPISFYIAENLKPLRDFFLIMFFFSLGASFELPMLPQVLVPALILALVVLVIKPLVFKTLLLREGERENMSWQIGTRLGQMSEFALLIAVLAVDAEVIGGRASYLIQATTLFTIIVSSYVIMLRYPTPIAVSDRLRRD